EAVATRLREGDVFSDISLAGPGFLNLTVTNEVLVNILTDMAEDPRQGAWHRPDPEKVMIDYGGPNVAKPLHVGHLRSAIIGEAMKRLFRVVGDDVLGDIHLGDWGLQMGQLISQVAIEQPDLPYFDENASGPYPEVSPVTVEELARIYPLASTACKEDEGRMKAAQTATAELQAGRPGYRALWQHFIDVSKAALEKDYAELGVSFDLWKGEADADPFIPPLVEKLKADHLLEESDGAQVVMVARESDKKEMPPLMVIKSNGSVGYGSTDLATILERVQDFNVDRIIYVVDQRQGQHFEQVFRAADLAGLIKESQLEHTGFGTMNGKDGKPFKTREGGVLRLRDLIDMVVREATERLAQGGMVKDYSPEEQAEIAKRVGIAALKFADLSNPRMSDYIFDPEKFVTFEGKTGPYLLYATVRIKSVLTKAGEDGEGHPFLLEAQEEKELALALAAYPEAVKSAYEKRLPHILCDHAYRLGQSFSKFYAQCRIGDEANASLRQSRLRLAKITYDQLIAVLDILGIEVPDRM
ncbi:MAG: arginine--tRNA ligase, partial [Pseudomonadota bacterium]